MCAKKKHSKSSDFLHYLKDELSMQERHELERSLEADPFEREAMEGLQSIGHEKAGEDLLSLHASLNRRLSRRRRRTWFSIAATAASLLLMGTIFLNIYDFNPDRDDTEVLTEETFRELNADEETPPKATEEIVAEKETATGAEVAAQDIALEKVNDAEIVAVEAEPAGKIRSATKEKIAAPATYPPEARAAPQEPGDHPAKAGKGTPAGQVRGVVVSSEDLGPLPGANVTISGGNSSTLTDSQGRFTLPADDSQTTVTASFIGMETEEFRLDPEANNQLVLTPDAITLDEVVVISSAIERKSSPTSATAIQEEKKEKNVSLASSEPEGGFKSYRDYVRENMIFPQEYSPGERKAVILSFTVTASGNIENIEPLRSPGEAYTHEAMRLVQDGPDWTPARSESGPVDEQVRLRIVFKK